MKNLLIGGSGFIGSALGEELVRRGEEVVSISRSGNGDAHGVRSVCVDLYESSCPQEEIDNAECIYVLTIGQIREGFDSSREKQVVSDLVQSLKKSTARIFYFSSVAVYGHTPHPVHEDSTCKPIGEYGVFKLETEAIFKEHIKPEQLSILRLANIYGTPKNKGFIGLIMNRLSQSNPSITVNGDGQQQRDYVLIDDLIHAILKIRERPFHGDVVNISTAESHALVEVVTLINEITGKQVSYTITHAKVNEPQDSLIDNSKLKEKYHYAQFTPLKDGLKKVVQRYKQENLL